MNIDPFFASPIDAGLCSLTDLKTLRQDGNPLLSLAEVCDLNEILAVRYENERRAHKSAESTQKMNQSHGR